MPNMEITVAFKCSECGQEEEYGCVDPLSMFNALNQTSEDVLEFSIEYEVCSECARKIIAYAMKNHRKLLGGGGAE